MSDEPHVDPKEPCDRCGQMSYLAALAPGSGMCRPCEILTEQESI